MNDLPVYIDDTHPDYIIIGRFKFPKGTSIKKCTAVVVKENGELLPAGEWEITTPMLSPMSIISPEKSLDKALLEAHLWLYERGHLQFAGILEETFEKK